MSSKADEAHESVPRVSPWCCSLPSASPRPSHFICPQCLLAAPDKVLWPLWHCGCPGWQVCLPVSSGSCRGDPLMISLWWPLFSTKPFYLFIHLFVCSKHAGDQLLTFLLYWLKLPMSSKAPGQTDRKIEHKSSSLI